MSAEKQTNWQDGYRCPQKSGRVEAQRNKTGMCFTIERVEQDGRRGYVTSLHNRASGRKVGFTKGPPSSGCSLTPDPFAAGLLPKALAVHTGATCAVQLTPAKKPRAKPAKKAKGRKKAK